jgi:hypothetical protein
MARLGKFFYISVAPTFDSDAQAFFDRVTTAGGTLTTTEKQAVNQLVLDMKSAGIWSSMKAIYPMVGASAAACAQNLKSSSFTGTFTSGWTFASTGVTPNGTSAYMNTGLNASTQLTTNNVHYSIYSRTNITGGGGVYYTDMGCSDSPTDAETGNYLGLFIKRPIQLNLSAFECNRYSTNVGASFTNSNGQCMIIGSRTSSTLNRIYRNGTLQSSATLTNLGVNPNYNVYLAANNKLNTATNFSVAQNAFSSIGDGLTDTQASDLYTAVQAFQTTLSRQV